MKNPSEFVGIHHFGFQCDDLEAQQKKIEAAGGKFFFDLGDPDDDDFERKFKDPNGIIFDINWKGWTMTSSKVKTKKAAKKAAKNATRPAGRAAAAAKKAPKKKSSRRPAKKTRRR